MTQGDKPPSGMRAPSTLEWSGILDDEEEPETRRNPVNFQFAGGVHAFASSASDDKNKDVVVEDVTVNGRTVGCVKPCTLVKDKAHSTVKVVNLMVCRAPSSQTF